MFKKAVREVNELKFRLEYSSSELELLKSRANDEECDSCLMVMSEIAKLKTLHAQVISQLETVEKNLLEKESRPTLLCACKNFPSLSKDVDVKAKHVNEIESRLESVESSTNV